MGIFRKLGKFTAYSVLAGGLLGGSLTGVLVLDYKNGIISKNIGEYLDSRKDLHSNQTGYWKRINEFEDLKAKLNEEDLEKKVKNGRFPDLDFLDKWSVTENNEISILGDDGKEFLKKPASRVKVECEDIPEVVKKALVLREDQQFYEHSGINWRSKPRSTFNYVKNLFTRKSGRLSGGSGITEQAAKLAISGGEIVIRSGLSGKLRKAEELLLATELDLRGKDEVLCFYANNIALGDRNYGIGAAALDYFDKDARELTFNEALFLSVLINNPGVNPKSKSGFEKQIKKHRNFLNELYKSGKLSRNEFDEYTKEGAIQIKPGKKEHLISDYLTSADAVIKQLKDIYNLDIFDLIHTHDPNFSIKVETTLLEEDSKILKQAVHNRLKDYKDKAVQVGAVVLDKNRNVVAIIGNKNTDAIWADNYAIDKSMRNIGLGSIVKPFFYGIAYEEGIIRKDDLFDDTDTEGIIDPPKNWSDKYHGIITASESLAYSDNVNSRKIYDIILKSRQKSFKMILDYLKDLGFDITEYKNSPGDGSLILGSKGGLTPLELAASFMSFKDGKYVEPRLIKGLVFNDERYYYESDEGKTIWGKETRTDIKESLMAAAEGIKGMPKGVYLKTGTTTNFNSVGAAGFFSGERLHRGFAIKVLRTDGSDKSLGENQYAAVVVAPIIREYAKARLGYVLPVEIDGQRKEVCELEISQLETTILQENNPETLYRLEKRFNDCNEELEYGEEWAKNIYGAALVNHRLNDLYLEGDNRILQDETYNAAFDYYQKIIENDDSESNVFKSAKNKLEELESANN